MLVLLICPSHICGIHFRLGWCNIDSIILDAIGLIIVMRNANIFFPGDVMADLRIVEHKIEVYH